MLFCCLRKLCFNISKTLKILLDFICSNRTYSLKFDSCIPYFWYFGKTQKCLEPSRQHREGLLVAPLVDFCRCFCTVLYPQQTANLAWIKSWFSSPLCPAWLTGVKSGAHKPVQVSTCWVRAVSQDGHMMKVNEWDPGGSLSLFLRLFSFPRISPCLLWLRS